MAKPLVKPRWASTVTADPTRYFEPPAGKKDIGWDVGERPPAQYENWLRGTTNDWIDWLDSYESTAHTWTATQTFTPSTAAPGIVLGYNSATATANETPALSFVAGANTMSVVDRLGIPSKRHITKEYMWWGAPNMTVVGAADTDELLDGETQLWQRHSGPGPGPSFNLFAIRLRLPEKGSSVFHGHRYLAYFSNFASVMDQYHVVFGDSLVRHNNNFRALAMEFSIFATLPTPPAESIVAIGLLERGLDTLPGVVGRNLLTAPNSFCIATANIYGGRWQVFKRISNVTTPTDTGVLANDYRRIRMEIIKDPALGGPRTNVFIDGVNVHSSTSPYSSEPYFAFGMSHTPVVIGGSCQLLVSPVRITAIFNDD